MPSDQPESGPGVYVIGIDKAENTGPIYEALRQAGCAWRGQALSLNEALRQLELIKDAVDLVVVRADLARRGEEAALLEPIARWPVVVLLGAARADRQAAIAQLPNVRQVLVVPPYDFHALETIQVKKTAPAESAAPPVVTAATPAGAEVMISSPRPPVRGSRPVTAGSSTVSVARTRLAFFGMRGGVGTSTAALRAAQLLAGQGLRVAVFDAAQRGDLHVMVQPRTPRSRASRTARFTSVKMRATSGRPLVVMASTFAAMRSAFSRTCFTRTLSSAMALSRLSAMLCTGPFTTRRASEARSRTSRRTSSPTANTAFSPANRWTFR